MAEVRELMTPEPVKVPADTPIGDCARILWRLNIRHLPVVDEHGSLIGVVSDFDVLQRGAIVGDDGTWAERGNGETSARELARTLPVECRADDDLLHVLSEMRDLQRDVAIVVDLRRHPVGIVTEHDAVRWSRAFLSQAPTLVDAGAPIFAVQSHEQAFAAFHMMVEHGVRHVLVMEDGAAIGVVSWRDLVVEDLLDYRSVRVQDLMTAEELVWRPVGTSMRDLAEVMVVQRIGCVPLLDEDGIVRAIVTRSDVIAAVLGAVPFDDGGR